MTLSGLEPIQNEIITPAVDVAVGRSTVDDVHRKYKGMELICPHCLKEWSARIGDEDVKELILGQKQLYPTELLEELRQGLDNSNLLERIQLGVRAFPAQLQVKFRQGTLDKTSNQTRWMHWYHTDRRDDRGSKPPCYDPGSIDHAVAVGAMQLRLEEDYKSHSNVQVSREKDVIITPGEPPLKRRPDLAVKEFDRVITIFEIQRTPIQKDDFIERTQHLLSICPDVQWIFFKGTYAKMAFQRRWLTDMGLSYHYLFLDENSRIVVEPGRPPATKQHKVAQRSVNSTCRFDDPNELRQSMRNHPSEPPLPLSVVGPAVFARSSSARRERSHQLPRWNCSVGDIVEVWADGRWVKGEVIRYYQPDIPIVRLHKTIVKRRTKIREVSPSEPHLIRQFQQPQQEENRQDHPTIFDLFPELN